MLAFLQNARITSVGRLVLATLVTMNSGKEFDWVSLLAVSFYFILAKEVTMIKIILFV